MLTGPQFGKHLREIARKKRVTNAALASAAGVSPQAVTGWFGTGRISKDSMAAIAPLLGASLDELFAVAPDDVLGSGAMPLPATLTSTTVAEGRYGPTLASLCRDRRLTAKDLANHLRVSDQRAARLISGDDMLTLKQRTILGTIFQMDPSQITDAAAVTAQPVPGNARKRSVTLDGYEFQLIQQYRHLPESAQHVLRAHAALMEETFAARSSETPFSRIDPPGGTEPPDQDPPRDSDYGSW